MTDACQSQTKHSKPNCEARLVDCTRVGLHHACATSVGLSWLHTRRQPLIFTLLAASFITLTSGCGYTTQRPFRTDIQTIHVEMFQSKEFRRELEMSLTEAVIKRIQMDTPYHLAPRESADALFTGEILSVDNSIFGDDFGTDLPREIGATVTVRYRLQDLRNGEVLVERPRFIYQASYIPPLGESFTTGMIRGLDGMAERIVETMEVDW